MIQPIPINLLIHEVVYEEYLGNPSGLGEEYKDKITLKNVRMDAVISKGKVNGTATSEQYDNQYTMFYDVVHSTPPVDIVEKSKVTFNGRVFTVTRPNPIYAFTLHHYEAGLS
jgi:Minor capsid protein